jgi:hypothetical protein
MKIMIHQLRENDLAEADRIFRLAFGTFFGLSDPVSFAGDADYVRNVIMLTRLPPMEQRSLMIRVMVVDRVMVMTIEN